MITKTAKCSPRSPVGDSLFTYSRRIFGFLVVGLDETLGTPVDQLDLGVLHPGLVILGAAQFPLAALSAVGPGRVDQLKRQTRLLQLLGGRGLVGFAVGHRGPSNAKSVGGWESGEFTKCQTNGAPTVGHSIMK